MKKTTNWDLYYRKQMGDPEMRALIEEELKALRVGTELARLRRTAHMSQTQLAAENGNECAEHLENRDEPRPEHDARNTGQDCPGARA